MPRRDAPDAAALVIGRRVKQLREEAGLGLEALAHQAEFSKGHLSNLEHGLVMPTVATLTKLAEALGVLVADLVIDPDGSPREQVIDRTRRATAGTIKRLAKELGALPPKPARSP